MKIYTAFEAQKKLARVLDEAMRDGGVQITRRDGSLFMLFPVKTENSPLDVPGVRLSSPMSREDIVSAVREARERS